MEKKRKGRQNRPDKGSEQPVEEKGKSVEVSRPRSVPDSKRMIQQGIEKAQERKSRELTKTRGLSSAVRPRIVSDSKRVIRHGIEKIHQRKPRELTKTRGLGSPVRPSASSTGLIQHQEKKFPTGRATVVEEEPKTVSALEEQELVKWAAWGALVISIIALVSLGVYSVREFSPTFEFHDLKAVQKQIAADVNELKLTTRIEKIKTALTNAHVQLMLRQDYTAAEAMVMKAEQNMKDLIGSLPVEKKDKSEELLNNIEAILQEIRRSPSALADTLEKIVLDLDKI